MSLPATLWAERSGRERWMIAALAALIGGVVYWYGLWLPLGGWRHLAAQRLDTARRVSVEAERVRAETAKLHQPGPLESDITVSAREAGVRLGKIEASGKAVTVRLEGAESARVLAWTRDLAEHKAIAVTNLTATAASGGTIDVEAVMTRPGG